MTLQFRNLTITPAAPVIEWPLEGVHTALERGYLGDWRRIVAELDRDPWGRTAQYVECVLGFDRPYGIADAIEVALAEARARAREDGRAVASAGRPDTDAPGL